MNLRILSAFGLLPLCLALGITVQPIKAGDSSKLSSTKNLLNCVTYQTVINDIVRIRVRPGDGIHSQQLDLHVFDEEGNDLRTQPDLQRDVAFMFTNLNTGSSSRLVGFKRENEANDTGNKERAESDAISLIHVCLDNLYNDKSWSFHASTRDVEIYVDIKTANTIKETNYDTFIQYFQKLQIEQDKHKEGFHVTESDFDEEIEFLKAELNSVVDSLGSSERILQDLQEQERLLRDVNEDIFAKYMQRAVAGLVCTALFGLLQLFYIRWYLKRHNIV